jgi:hypothetical protein
VFFFAKIQPWPGAVCVFENAAVDWPGLRWYVALGCPMNLPWLHGNTLEMVQLIMDGDA